jgi:carbon-monoxide dehydrogenase medium subunit
MYAFSYHRPDTVRQAAGLLVRKEDAKLIAGGHTLLPTMKQRLASPGALIDLGAVAEMKGIERRGRAVFIGAMTTHGEVAESAIVREAIPGLAELAGGIGDPQVRHRGTLGGSVANNDPAACYPAACLALGAMIVTNKRRIPAHEFFQGMFDTALEEGEIVTKVAFPVPSKAAYAKFRNPASRYALVGVFVAKRGADVRVAVTGAGASGVFRWAAAEEALSRRFSSKSLLGLAASAEGINSDIHADAEYRAHLIGVMTRRAVDAAVGR